MTNLDGCQLPCVPKFSIGITNVSEQSTVRRIKRLLAVPWNYHIKPWIKQAYRIYAKRFTPDKSGKTIKLAKAEFPLFVLAAPSENYVDTQQQQLVGQLPHTENGNSVLQGKLNAGDWVHVRSRAEIQAMLDPFKETKGCAFLEDMYKYCDTKQRVFKSMERFLDERDYKVKKVHGVILLENVICSGTPAFGRCDRSCFLFWREEWLEKIEEWASVFNSR
jgi:hypothetical protein